MTTRSRLTPRLAVGERRHAPRSRAPSRGPAVSVPPNSAARSRMPISPWPPGLAARRRAVAAVGDRRARAPSGRSRSGDRRGRAAGVLDHVRQRLLHDPERRQVDALGERPRRALDRELDVDARAARARSSSSSSVAEPGLRARARRRRRRAAASACGASPPSSGGRGRRCRRSPRARARRRRWRRAPAPGRRSARRCGRPRRAAPARSAAAPRPAGALAPSERSPLARDAALRRCRARRRSDHAQQREPTIADRELRPPATGRRRRRPRPPRGGDRRLPRALRADRVERDDQRDRERPSTGEHRGRDDGASVTNGQRRTQQRDERERPTSGDVPSPVRRRRRRGRAAPTSTAATSTCGTAAQPRGQDTRGA